MKKQSVKRLLSALLVSTMVISSATTVSASKKSDFTMTEVDPILNLEDVDATKADEETVEYADTDDVRVFIVMEDESVVDAGYSTADIAENETAIEYSEELEEAQNEVVEKIEDEVLEGEGLDQRYSFTLLTNAISAEVKYGDIEEIENVDGVEAVYIVPQYETQKTNETAEPNTMTSGEMVGSYNTWTAGYTGAGMRVAVIDTGLDTDHPSFDSAAYLYSLEEVAAKAGKSVEDYDLLDAEEIEGVLPQLNASAMYRGLTVSDVNLNSKVPYAFNYVDEDLDVTHDNDSQGDHGTHVSGISTANRYVPTADGFAAQESGVVGIAPEAQLFVMKVFGKGGGAYTDDYMAAIEDAILLGADAVNLSLGSNSAGESAAGEAYINKIMDKLLETDTVVSISAGNAGFWSQSSEYGANLTSDVDADTVGSPGSYTNAFTVASAVNSGYTGYSALFNGQVNAYYDDGSSANNAPFTSLDATGDGTEYDYVFLDGFGTPEDFEGLDVAGKIVLVSRGSISFFEKHDNAANAGAAAVLVYNNTTGTIGMNLTGSSATIPCASITRDEALAIKAGASLDEATGTYTGKVVVSSKVSTRRDVEDGYTMSDFSSWGVPGSLELKPEITAPGGNIYSTITNGQYGNMSGTSMAAPSITGMSALVIQYIEENNLAEKTGLTARALAQSLLMSTAAPLKEKSGAIYSPRKQGAGLANVANATTSKAYIMMKGDAGKDGKVKAELGDDPERTGEYSFAFDVKNYSDKTQYFTVDSDVLTESVLQDFFIANSSYKLNPEVSIEASEEDMVYVYDANEDGSVDADDVAAMLAYANGSEYVEMIACHMDAYDMNENGVVDTSDVRSLLLAINGKASEVDLTTQEIAVKDSTEINVSITLSEEDKEYIEENFENGMYVEGYVYLNGSGAVDLSVPFLAFYGNWTDSSMFEPYDFLEDYHTGDTWPTYSGIEKTNYLTYKFASKAKADIYTSNMFAKDDEYMSERNAISSESGDSIGSFVYSLIRNAASVEATVTDADTDEVYYSVKKGAATGAYYSSSNSSWMSTSSQVALNWKVTDADGEPLLDGTKVNINVTALPAYYNDETKTPGKGATLSIPMVVDNEAPRATYNKKKGFVDNKATITVQDNQYVAAVYVYGSDKRTVLSKYAVNQEDEGEAVDVEIEYPSDVFYMSIVDYAGNVETYRINQSGQPDAKNPTAISLSSESMDLMVGGSKQLFASLEPVTLAENAQGVTWKSDDPSVATVDSNGVVTAVAKGETTITVTAKQKSPDKKYLSATCHVNVMSIEADLSCVLYDEKAEVYFSEFNTSELPTFTKVSGKQSHNFWSTAVVGPYLVCSTESENQGASEYYVVDPSDNYYSEKLFESYWNTDMAFGVASRKLFGTYGNYLIVSGLTTGMEGAYDLTKYMDGENLIGVAFAGLGKYDASHYMEYFYLLDDSGLLILLGYVDGLGYMAQPLGNTGISTNGAWYYQSLYYDFEQDFLFFTCYDNSEEVTLYGISDGDEVEAYAMGKFPEKVWPVSGLYKASDLAAGQREASADTVAKVSNATFEAVSLSQDIAMKDAVNLAR